MISHRSEAVMLNSALIKGISVCLDQEPGVCSGDIPHHFSLLFALAIELSMAQKTIMLNIFIFLMVQHNFVSMVASRKIIHTPPAIPRSPQPPSSHRYTPNDEIGDGGGDAYRPTSPGHSPGVGHGTPPKKG